MRLVMASLIPLSNHLSSLSRMWTFLFSKEKVSFPWEGPLLSLDLKRWLSYVVLCTCGAFVCSLLYRGLHTPRCTALHIQHRTVALIQAIMLMYSMVSHVSKIFHFTFTKLAYSVTRHFYIQIHKRWSASKCWLLVERVQVVFIAQPFAINCLGAVLIHSRVLPFAFLKIKLSKIKFWQFRNVPLP